MSAEKTSRADLLRQFADRVPGECDWRDHLPDVDTNGLAALNQSGKNRVNQLLVEAFREIDRGRSLGLTWPSGWKNGAGITPKRAGDIVATHHAAALESARKMRDTLPELRGLIASLKKVETALKRGRPGQALEHLRAAQGTTWTPWELRYTLRRPTPEQLPALRAIVERTEARYEDARQGPASRLAQKFILVKDVPRRLLREQRVNAMRRLADAYCLDTEREPTLISKDWRATPAEGSFDAYLSIFCRLARVPESAMRDLFREHRP